MIISLQPVSLAEVEDYLQDVEEKKEMRDFIKKFTKLSKEDSDKLREELVKLNNHKIKKEYLVKTIDFLPRDLEDIHKIFSDVALDEKEANEILDIVRKY